MLMKHSRPELRQLALWNDVSSEGSKFEIAKRIDNKERRHLNNTLLYIARARLDVKDAKL